MEKIMFLPALLSEISTPSPGGILKVKSHFVYLDCTLPQSPQSNWHFRQSKAAPQCDSRGCRASPPKPRTQCCARLSYLWGVERMSWDTCCM